MSGSGSLNEKLAHLLETAAPTPIADNIPETPSVAPAGLKADDISTAINSQALTDIFADGGVHNYLIGMEMDDGALYAGTPYKGKAWFLAPARETKSMTYYEATEYAAKKSQETGKNWYVPNITELANIFMKGDRIDGFKQDQRYWTGSEVSVAGSDEYAEEMSFKKNTAAAPCTFPTDVLYKGTQSLVRLVRN